MVYFHDLARGLKGDEAPKLTPSCATVVAEGQVVRVHTDRALEARILALADRVLVMNEGRVTGELPIEECSESQLGVLMTGGGTPQAVSA